MLKNSIRREILARRSRLSEADCLVLSLHAQERFLSLPEFREAATIALYSPFRREVQTEILFRHARAQGKRVAYPRVRGDGLEFVEIARISELTPGAFGILEPAGERIFSLEELDLVVVPGVAFDLSGNRLGYGKGFYDRLFHGGVCRAVYAGLCYEVQLVPALPAENHDIPMDLLVTESRAERCLRSASGHRNASFFQGGKEP